MSYYLLLHNIIYLTYELATSNLFLRKILSTKHDYKRKKEFNRLFLHLVLLVWPTKKHHSTWIKIVKLKLSDIF